MVGSESHRATAQKSLVIFLSNPSQTQCNMQTNSGKNTTSSAEEMKDFNLYTDKM